MRGLGGQNRLARNRTELLEAGVAPILFAKTGEMCAVALDRC